MKKKIEKIFLFFKKKNNNNIKINIIKNYISFSLETTKEKIKYNNISANSEKKIKDKIINYNEYIKKIKKKDNSLIFINGKLIENNIKEIEVYSKIKKKLKNDLKNFIIDCVNNNLNLNYIINNLFCENKTFIKISKNLNEKIKIINIYIKQDITAIKNKIYLIIDDDVNVNITNYNLKKNSNLLNNNNLNIYLKKKSKLSFKNINSNKKKNLEEISIYTKQLKNAHLFLKEFCNNNTSSYLNKNFFLIGEKSEMEEKTGYLLNKKTDHKINCNVKHLNAETNSDIILKVITKEQSNFNFKGNIDVAINIEKTKSKLVCKGLLLSNNSNIELTPELSINNNNVISSHAATIGNINDNIIKYMQSRGLKLKECIDLMTEIFFEEII